MEFTMIAAIIIFLVSIFLVITGIIDTVVAAFLGVVFMIAFKVMTDVDAFKVVDWNVIFILVGIWIIATYLGKTGLPEYMAAKLLIWSKGNVALFITFIGASAGFISLVVDNVVVVLMMAPVLFAVSRQFKFPAYGAILFIGLCSNFMGTALLLGDLPPQLLHSVTGIEFGGFLWHSGRPSSFFVLLATYVVVVSVFYFIFKRKLKGQQMDFDPESQNPRGAHQKPAFRLAGLPGLCGHHRGHGHPSGVRGASGHDHPGGGRPSHFGSGDFPQKTQRPLL